MRLDNGKISERQSFRMGLIENITLGIIVVPYICASNAGGQHYMAFALGMIFTFLYSLIIYFYSKAFPNGMIEETDELLGKGGKVIDVLYAVRYIIKASIITLFFAVILREYMLRSFNLWVIIVSFTLICGYGASRDIEKRGRLIELLFWWMIVPLILVAVFSVSNVDWRLNGIKGNVDYKGILMGGYEMLIVMSSVETMLFTLTKVKKTGWSGYLKTIIWVLVALLFSYIFVQGVIGERWAGDSSMSVLYVMEAARFPGGIERMDYAVVAFLLIGVFAVISGYMFYAKEFLRVAFSKRWNEFEKDERGMINNNSIQVVSDKWWTIVLVMILSVLGSWLWSLYGVSDILLKYLLWFDIGISLVIPLLIYLVKYRRKKSKSVNKVELGKSGLGVLAGKRTVNLCLCFLLSMLFLTGCKSRISYGKIDDRQSSLETMDYAVTLTVRGNLDMKVEDYIYTFKFEIADLSDYKGDSEDLLTTDEYECMAGALDVALDDYYTAKEKHVDLGHLKLIRLYNVDPDLIDELKNMPSITKSVEVKYYYGDNEEKIKLRNLIKKLYAGEEF